MIKVLLADDQELIRQSLSFVMSKQEDIEMVGTAANGCEALELVEEKQPDVVLLDIRMPEMDGVECTRRIKQEFPGIKVIILTTFDDDDYVFDALRYGASGYLLKGGMPHAIGAGCFLVEIQEPTDYTIRVERTTPSGFAVADSMCHQGLGFEKMFECFHYEPHSREEIHDRWFIEPETVLKTAGGSITTLVGYRNTPLFRLDEVNVSDTLTVDCPPRGSGIYVLEGAGTLSANGRSLPLKKTDQLFVPAGTGRFTLDAEAPLRVLHFFGPEQKQ